MWDLFPTELVTKMKPNINSVEVHPQLSNYGHPVHGVLVGAGSLWPCSFICKMNSSLTKGSSGLGSGPCSKLYRRCSYQVPKKMNSHQLTPGELKHVGPNEYYMGSVVTVKKKTTYFLPSFSGCNPIPRNRSPLTLPSEKQVKYFESSIVSFFKWKSKSNFIKSILEGFKWKKQVKNSESICESFKWKASHIKFQNLQQWSV